MSQLRTSLSWLPALRTGAAALMAMLAGHVLSSERWFWAVITVFVVFLGTRSRGDTLYRAMQRIAGTLAGGLVSALLVTSLHDQPAAIAAAMLLCVFGWAYFIMSAYGPGVFFITVLVGLVYGGLGLAVQPLVELRIEEVAIGCLAALIAAFTVKPLDTTSHIEARFVGVVDALIEGVSAASANADENQGGPPPRSERWIVNGTTSALHCVRSASLFGSRVTSRSPEPCSAASTTCAPCSASAPIRDRMLAANTASAR